jgi:hypothetical protein
MSDSQSIADYKKIDKWLNRAVTYVTAATVITAALVHIITFLPEAYSKLFPEHDLKLLGFYSRRRVTVSNRGDFDYFLSHLSYKQNFDYVYETRERSQAMLDDHLYDMCLDFHNSQPQDDSQNQNSTPEMACAEAMKKAQARLTRLVDGKEKEAPWVPGEKNRSIGKMLPRESTLQFKLEGGRWSSCPSIKNVSDDTLKNAVALWSVSYRALPGQCLDANYYYTGDRNYHDKLREDPTAADSLVPAEAQLHLYATNVSDNTGSRGATEDSEVMGRTLIAIPLPREEIVSELRYRNTEFCAKHLREIVGFQAALGVPEGQDCFSGG